MFGFENLHLYMREALKLTLYPNILDIKLGNM